MGRKLVEQRGTHQEEVEAAPVIGKVVVSTHRSHLEDALDVVDIRERLHRRIIIAKSLLVLLDAPEVARHHADVGDDRSGDEGVKNLTGDHMVADATHGALGRDLRFDGQRVRKSLHRGRPLLLLVGHGCTAALLLLDAPEVIHDDAHKEIDGKDVAHTHPRECIDRRSREVVAHCRMARARRAHHDPHRLLPRVAGAHDVEHEHRLTKVVERAPRRG